MMIGDIGTSTDPLQYLYNKDLEHPSQDRCPCRRYLHIQGNSSCSGPISYYYHTTCIYHMKDIKTILFNKGGNKYAYYPDTNTTTNIYSSGPFGMY